MSFDIHQTDKLCIFVDDMRRMGIACLPPCINRSEADFSVEPHEDGHAVRYALGGLKGVGEKAMETLVAEREANGAFGSLDDFANRVEPRLLNRRQLESLAAGGAFDSINPDRAGVHAAAETILAVASSAAEARSSGQGGLFGTDEVKQPDIQIPSGIHWSLADRMAQEKDAFGFYFSAHPVDRFRPIADANGAKSFGLLCSQPASADVGRTGAVMAALVEEVRWRDTKRGKRYISATLSDNSGQFQASCFDEDICKQLEELGNAGDCGLLTVELDRQPGEEVPRVTIRNVQSFSRLSNVARLVLRIDVTDPRVVESVAQLVSGSRSGRSEIVLRTRLDDGRIVRVRLGRDFMVEAELAARVGALPGVVDYEVKAAESPRLALVS